MFRKATTEDIDRIVEIYSNIFDAEENGTGTSGWKRGFYPNRDVAVGLAESGEGYVEIDDNGLIVCSGRFNEEYDEYLLGINWQVDCRPEETLVLHTLAADPLEKGKGYGMAFLQFYEKVAKEAGKKALRMNTGGGNSRSRALYKKAGFKEVDVKYFDWGREVALEVIYLEKEI